jgi:hypothetical protein
VIEIPLFACREEGLEKGERIIVSGCKYPPRGFDEACSLLLHTLIIISAYFSFMCISFNAQPF